MQANLLGQGFVLAVNLLVTPLVVRGLGTDGYALYTLMFTLMSYLTLLNLGTNNAAAQHAAKDGFGPSSSLGALVRRTAALQVVMASAGGLVLFLARGRLAGMLCRGSPAAMEAAPWVFACVAAAAPAYFLLQLGDHVLYGLQRFRTHSSLLAAQSTGVALAAAAILRSGGSLRGVAAAFVWAHAALAAVAVALAAGPVLGPSRTPAAAERAEFARFSLRSQLALLSMLLIEQGDRLFVAAILPLSQMGYYTISSSLAQKLNLLSGSVAVSAYPMLAELHGAGQQERLRRFYLRSTELMLFFILGPAVLACVLAPQFLTLWLGQEFSARGTWPFRLILAANLSILLSAMPRNLAAGKGHPHLPVGFQFAKVALVFACWPALIARWGILGAAAGMLLGEAVVAPAFVVTVHRRFLGLGLRQFLAEACLRPAGAALGLAVLGLAWHASIGSWIALAASGAAGLAAFLALGYALLDEEARAQARGWARSRLG